MHLLQFDLDKWVADFSDQDREVLSDVSMIRDSHSKVLVCSPFVAESIKLQPGLLFSLSQTGDLFRDYSSQDMAQNLAQRMVEVEDESSLLQTLRRFRRREMVRIAWRDLANWSTTQQTLLELTWLADACVDAALNWFSVVLQKRHGKPRDALGNEVELVVLGMGKLGGHELNFSSDIDLIFAYDEEGETDGAKPLANSEYFSRLGQRLIRAIDARTEDGFVFRVDMRLRPWGDDGPLAMSFDQMEVYYTLHGREWERYALIKARPMAGDLRAGERLMQQLRPFVFRRYLDFGAFAQLREMKQMIEREMAKKGMRDNIKLGPGGIREVEFIGQVFQLLRGGREVALQQRGILPVLHVLQEDGVLNEAEFQTLSAGYDMLRRVENRLQAAYDQQTQLLPEDPREQQRLALSMDAADWEVFIAQLNQQRAAVHDVFRRVFRILENDQAPNHDLDALCSGNLANDAALKVLGQLGIAEDFIEATHAQLQSFLQERFIRGLSETARMRLMRLLPRLLQGVALLPNIQDVLARMFVLLARIAGRSVYLALLLENPQALELLIRLVAASPWIADQLTLHPILLDELLDPRTLFSPPGVDDLRRELNDFLRNVAEDDIERQMDELRRFKQINTLRVASADIMQALPVMQVSDHLTWMAEILLEETYRQSYEDLLHRHGEPVCTLDGQVWKPGLAVIGYGKLGGLELGYSSDLDIVFLHDSAGEIQQTDGARSIDNAQFFAKVTQKMISRMTTATSSGVLYDVDTRLRPDGASGLLVSSLSAFEDYQLNHAWVWEHQALTRARWVAGETNIKAAFEAVRQKVLCQPREIEALRQNVVAMRNKMRAELDQSNARGFHIKTGFGGLTDIEFIVQFHLLAFAHEHPQIVAFSDNIRQLEALAAAGILSHEESEGLADAYRRLRDRGHRLALENRKPVIEDHELQSERQFVRAIWQRRMEPAASSMP